MQDSVQKPIHPVSCVILGSLMSIHCWVCNAFNSLLNALSANVEVGFLLILAFKNIIFTLYWNFDPWAHFYMEVAAPHINLRTLLYVLWQTMRALPHCVLNQLTNEFITSVGHGAAHKEWLTFSLESVDRQTQAEKYKGLGSTNRPYKVSFIYYCIIVMGVLSNKTSYYIVFYRTRRSSDGSKFKSTFQLRECMWDP